LENGKTCCFYVETRKRGYDNRTSKKVMVKPSEPEEASVIENVEKVTLGLGDIKNDFSEIAYTNWDFEWNGGANCCISSAVMLYSITSGSTSVIDTSCYGGSLHPTKNQLLYVSDKGERTVEGHRPSYFVLYDVDTETYKYYRDEDNDIRYPVFTNDGERIIYTKNPPGSGFEIWQMNTQTEEKVQLIAHNPFSDNSLLDPDKPALSPDDNSLYFEAARSTDHGGPMAIWKYSFQDKTINTIFESVWDDTNPAVSPNGKMLAFISDRSGIENIWVYNFISDEHIQVTGSEGFSCRKGLGLLRWINNNTIAFCGRMKNGEGILSVGF
jgi:Tol biopolymer transport system component